MKKQRVKKKDPKQTKKSPSNEAGKQNRKVAKTGKPNSNGFVTSTKNADGFLVWGKKKLGKRGGTLGGRWGLW